jgi:hypothetical protein
MKITLESPAVKVSIRVSKIREAELDLFAAITEYAEIREGDYANIASAEAVRYLAEKR